MEPDYERTTNATTLAGLPAPLERAIAEHAAARGITLPPDTPAYLTHSRRLRKPGLLARITGSGDKDTEHLSAMVLGFRDLVMCTHGEHRGTAALSTRLELASTDTLTLAPPGDGVSVSGFPVSGEVGSYYFGLGPPDGEAARDALRAAIKAAKAP